MTRHLLAFPIIDFERNCLGVIQAINKNAGGAKLQGEQPKGMLQLVVDMSVLLTTAEKWDTNGPSKMS